MKKIILFLSLFLILILYTLPAYAELRTIAISYEAIIEEDHLGSRIKTGYKYSLYTGIKSEEVRNVNIEELITKIENVAWWGSVINVCIFYDQALNIQTLKSLINGIEKNPHMQIIYIGNKEINKQVELIKNQYNL